MNDPKLIFTAESIIQRDALRAHLQSEGVESISPDRDISRKYTENTLDLSHGGYSAFFDGFKVFVANEDIEKAKGLVGSFSSNDEQKEDRAEPLYLKKFYYFSIASVFIPFVPIVFGVYYLFKGIKGREKLNYLYFIFSSVLYFPQFLYIVAAYEKLTGISVF